jgi:hypothetical protein
MRKRRVLFASAVRIVVIVAGLNLFAISICGRTTFDTAVDWLHGSWEQAKNINLDKTEISNESLWKMARIELKCTATNSIISIDNLEELARRGDKTAADFVRGLRAAGRTEKR